MIHPHFYCLNRLLEYLLGEVVETVLPNYEVVLTFWVLDESTRNSVLVAECLEA